jgi:hypothetical protein
MFSASPVNNAVVILAIGRKTVIMGSRRAYVMAIESTPVSGVEMRKERVAPFVAPLFFSESAVGTTPHEQSGSGIPIIEAFKADLNLPADLPRYLRIFSSGTSACNSPATANPRKRYGAASSNRPHDSARIPSITEEMVLISVIF